MKKLYISKKIIENLLNEIKDLKEIPKSGIGSVYLCNCPHYGGYTVNQVSNSGGGVFTWCERKKPKDFYEFLKSIKQEYIDSEEYKNKKRIELSNKLENTLSVKQDKKTTFKI